MNLIEIFIEFDPIIKEHVRCIKNSEICAHYLSNTIHNELIKLLVFQIKIKKVKDAKYLSIILDCTMDVSHQEQMTLTFKCVDTFSCPIKIEEYFLEFLQVNDTTEKGLFEELTAVLKKYDLDINDIRGQGYDNGSNMKGKNQGVQKRLLVINSTKFYTSFGCYYLDLVLYA